MGAASTAKMDDSVAAHVRAGECSGISLRSLAASNRAIVKRSRGMV